MLLTLDALNEKFLSAHSQILLTGNNEGLRIIAERFIEGHWQKNEGNFRKCFIEQSTIDEEQLAPFFAADLFVPHFAVKILCLSTLTGAALNTLFDYLEKVEPGIRVLVVLEEFDKKQMALKAYKKWIEQGVHIQALTKNHFRWVKEVTTLKKLDLSPEAMNLLVGLVEKDPLLLHQQLEKLSIIRSESCIQKEDLSLLENIPPEPDLFEIRQAAFEGDVMGAIFRLDKALQNGGSPVLICWSLQQAFLYLLEKKSSPAYDSKNAWQQYRLSYGLLKLLDQFAFKTKLPEIIHLASKLARLESIAKSSEKIVFKEMCSHFLLSLKRGNRICE